LAVEVKSKPRVNVNRKTLVIRAITRRVEELIPQRPKTRARKSGKNQIDSKKLAVTEVKKTPERKPRTR